jgi:hypothetical protein
LYGWEPKRTTEYEYDADGRLIRSVTTTEPEFTAAETSLLLYSRLQERSVNEYGIDRDIATDPANKHLFVAEPTIDYSVAKVEAAQREYREQYKHQNLDGYRWSVRLPVPDES